jgi:hypothetical protein
MSTLQAGGIDVSAATNTFPYHHNEMNPPPGPLNKIAILEMDWKAPRNTLGEWKLSEMKFQREKE